MTLFADQLIVVTGGAGFIGSGTIRALNDRGQGNVVVVDDFDHSESWKNLVKKQFVDIIPPDSLFDWLEGREREIGAIVHLGACTSTVETDGSYMLDNNTRYSIALAEYALEHNIRFIYASSAATYGDGTQGFSDAHEGLRELEPLNVYGYSKHLFDLWCQNQGVLDKVVGLKYFNIFGPNEWHKGRMASCVLHFLKQIQEEGEVRLFQSNDPANYADGEQCRDFLYVKDAVEMTLAFLSNQSGGIFNIGAGRAETWNAFAEAIFAALDREPNIRYIPMLEDLHKIYQNYTCADMSKTVQTLGPVARARPLTDGIGDYVQHHLLPGRRW